MDLWITPQAGETPRSGKTNPSHAVAIPNKRFTKMSKNSQERRKNKDRNFKRSPGFPSAARGDNKVRDKLDLWITPQAGDTPRSGKNPSHAFAIP